MDDDGRALTVVANYEGLTPLLADPDLPLEKPHYHGNKDDGNDGG